MLTEENLSTIYLANMDLIYWSVRSFSRRGRGVVKVRLIEGIAILAS